MTEITFEQLLSITDDTKSAYYKLVILAGLDCAAKLRLIKKIVKSKNIPMINFGLHLSRGLLDKTNRQRALKAEEVALDVLDSHIKGELCVDHTELLFSSSLELNPLVFLQEASRNRNLIANWNGPLESGDLVFGEIGHPDYFRRKVQGCPVIAVSADKLHLHLTS